MFMGCGLCVCMCVCVYSINSVYKYNVYRRQNRYTNIYKFLYP